MRVVEESELGNTKRVYLPHHAVFKESSSTTKLRVVFDASCKSDSGFSLNDILLVGANVQSDLIAILLKFRRFRYVFTADIVKMYRQILIDDTQIILLILWRFNTNEPIIICKMLTLTYGLASAAHSTTRSLEELAKINQDDLPLGAEVLEEDTYVDDVLSGGDTIEEAITKRDQVVTILKSGQFVLSKWSANHPQLLSGLSQSSSPPGNIAIDKNSESRILGMQWNSSEDVFRFTINVDSTSTKITKRTMLAEISQLFDPLGLLGPVILKAKILIQELWKIQMDWDSNVPMNIHTQWKQFKSQQHKRAEDQEVYTFYSKGRGGTTTWICRCKPIGVWRVLLY
ncbi:uncharacterized protein [Temnothorax longispinosus]|uniref:uncharacterized protein n=1 Tax=Temnothorax longispinosus TaxID=300112 RepID=UPI003A9A5C92